jgi:hypothetical protein
MRNWQRRRHRTQGRPVPSSQRTPLGDCDSSDPTQCFIRSGYGTRRAGRRPRRQDGQSDCQLQSAMDLDLVSQGPAYSSKPFSRHILDYFLMVWKITSWLVEFWVLSAVTVVGMWRVIGAYLQITLLCREITIFVIRRFPFMFLQPPSNSCVQWERIWWLETCLKLLIVA